MRKQSESGARKKTLLQLKKDLARGKRVAYQYGRVGYGGIKWDDDITGDPETLRCFAATSSTRSITKAA
jgi:hypothetical protein